MSLIATLNQYDAKIEQLREVREMVRDRRDALVNQPVDEESLEELMEHNKKNTEIRITSLVLSEMIVELMEERLALLEANTK